MWTIKTYSERTLNQVVIHLWWNKLATEKTWKIEKWPLHQCSLEMISATQFACSRLEFHEKNLCHWNVSCISCHQKHLLCWHFVSLFAPYGTEVAGEFLDLKHRARVWTFEILYTTTIATIIPLSWQTTPQCMCMWIREPNTQLILYLVQVFACEARLWIHSPSLVLFTKWRNTFTQEAWIDLGFIFFYIFTCEAELVLIDVLFGSFIHTNSHSSRLEVSSPR